MSGYSERRGRGLYLFKAPVIFYEQMWKKTERSSWGLDDYDMTDR